MSNNENNNNEDRFTKLVWRYLPWAVVAVGAGREFKNDFLGTKDNFAIEAMNFATTYTLSIAFGTVAGVAGAAAFGIGGHYVGKTYAEAQNLSPEKTKKAENNCALGAGLIGFAAGVTMYSSIVYQDMKSVFAQAAQIPESATNALAQNTEVALQLLNRTLG